MKKFLLICLASLLGSCASLEQDQDERDLEEIDYCPEFRTQLPGLWRDKVVPRLMDELRGYSVTFIDNQAPQYTPEMAKWLVLPSLSQIINKVPGAGGASVAVKLLGDAQARVDAFRVDRFDNIEPLEGDGIRSVKFNQDCTIMSADVFKVMPDIDVFTYLNAGILGKFRSFITLRPNVPVKLNITPFLLYKGESRVGFDIDVDVVPDMPGRNIEEVARFVMGKIGSEGEIGRLLHDPGRIIDFIGEAEKYKFTFRAGQNHKRRFSAPQASALDYCNVEGIFDPLNILRPAATTACNTVMDAVVGSRIPNIIGFFVMMSGAMQEKLEERLRFRVFMDPFGFEKR